MSKKVVVGMSGGVDSSVAVHLLKEQGFEVIGVTLELWRKAPDVCEDAIEAAENAAKMGVKHHIVHGKEEFDEKVISYFADEYLHGRTPNPCVRCNPAIKWKLLLDYADEIRADLVATGHYAKIIKLPSGRYGVLKGKDKTKDQSYVLAQLPQEQLSRTGFPLGDYTKEEIRKIAGDLNLPSASKKDSQDICFIDDGNYKAFIADILGDKLPPEGDFVLTDGRVVGRHKGITNYTIGQRKGLGIALGERAFVKEIDVANNRVVLGRDEDVYSNSLLADHWNQVGEEEMDPQKTYFAKIRYSLHEAPCHVKKMEDDSYKVEFLDKVRGVTAGQTVALYDGDLLVAGGIIVKGL